MRLYLLFLISFTLLANTAAAWECPKINPAGAAQTAVYAAYYSILFYLITMMPAAILSAEVKGDICPSLKGITSDAGCDLLHNTMVLGASSIAPVAGLGAISLAVSGAAKCFGAPDDHLALFTVPAVLMGVGYFGTTVMSLYTAFNYFLNRHDKLPSESDLKNQSKVDSAKDIEDIKILTVSNTVLNLLPYAIAVVAASFALLRGKEDTHPL